MRSTIWRLCAVLALMAVASISFAQAPLYTKGNVLVGFNFNDDPGSSDMTLIMRLLGDEEIYVDEGFEVKYIHDPDNQDEEEGWTEIDFDDKHWEDGISGVGFADGDDNTQVPGGRISIWTRYYFDAKGASKIKDLTLLADYDDQAIAWLNGENIFRSPGAPAGDPPPWNASQGGVPNNGATEIGAGQPNEARWLAGGIDRIVVDFKFAGTGIAVEARGKLAITWGEIRK